MKVYCLHSVLLSQRFLIFFCLFLTFYLQADCDNAVKSVEAGGYHSLSIKSDGTVWTWGYNNYGQLGDDTLTNADTPVQVVGSSGGYLEGVVAVAGGHYHSLALDSDGRVWGWGANNYGQLGNGSETDSKIPVQAVIEGVIAISAGDFFSLALKSDGTVWAWGNNLYGQFGDGTNTYSSIPVPSDINNVIAISAGANFTLALKNNGTIWAFGYNSSGQLGNGSKTNSSNPIQVSGLTNAIAVSAGTNHSLALTAQGIVYAWGYNAYGQLGNGTKTNSSVPVQVVGGLIDVAAISAGGNHSLAFKIDGTAWGWGYNLYGQVGNGTNADVTLPVQVLGGISGSYLTKVTAIAGGFRYSLALKDDGTVWAWGYNAYGQLGNDTSGEGTDSNVPVQTNDLIGTHGFKCIAGGLDFTIALRGDGTVWAWGYNRYGQLGNETTTNSKVPVQVKGGTSEYLTDVIAVAAGNYHSLALKSDGTVWAWGYNQYGQLGTGNKTNSSTPVQVDGGLTNVIAIAAGYLHSLALKSDGTLSGWGYNSYGQLGNGNKTSTSSPGPAGVGLTNVIAISTGDHGLALKSDGTVWGWGYNRYGQVGNGTKTDVTLPVQVKINSTTSLTAAVALATGHHHSLALINDGSVRSWGSNSYGQLGNGTTSVSYYAINAQTVDEGVAVNLNDVIAIAAGDFFSLAIRNDGGMWAWGDNIGGQLGDGSLVKALYAIQVLKNAQDNFKQVFTISGGGHHTLAIKSDGKVWAWGSNFYGQLGNGTNVSSVYPVITSDQECSVPPPENVTITEYEEIYGQTIKSKNPFIRYVLVVRWDPPTEGNVLAFRIINTKNNKQITQIPNLEQSHFKIKIKVNNACRASKLAVVSVGGNGATSVPVKGKIKKNKCKK